MSEDKSLISMLVSTLKSRNDLETASFLKNVILDWDSIMVAIGMEEEHTNAFIVTSLLNFIQNIIIYN